MPLRIPPDKTPTPVPPQIMSVPRKRGLIIFDFNEVLQHSERRYTNSVVRKRGILDTYKILYPRPDVIKFLTECAKYFDLGIWSCMVSYNLRNQMTKVLGADMLKLFRFRWGQEVAIEVGKNRDKPIFVKRFSSIEKHLTGIYHKENVVLIDDSPYKTSLNPFYSSLYPLPYNGGDLDAFLMGELLPYLFKLHTGLGTFHSSIRNHYPSWSADMLQLDYRENKAVWIENKYIQDNMDSEHRARYDDFDYGRSNK